MLALVIQNIRKNKTKLELQTLIIIAEQFLYFVDTVQLMKSFNRNTSSSSWNWTFFMKNVNGWKCWTIFINISISLAAFGLNILIEPILNPLFYYQVIRIKNTKHLCIEINFQSFSMSFESSNRFSKMKYINSDNFNRHSTNQSINLSI